ncbi:3'-5' exonuclease [Lachnospiraceae bacterium ZAX-1]
MVKDYVVIDLEMTGLCAKTDRILEIGAVKIKDHKIESVYDTLVNPHIKLNNTVRGLTGITDAMAANGMEDAVALKEFIAYCEDLPLVGHNVICDYSFLKQCAVNNNIVFEKIALDTLHIARKLPLEAEKKTLDYLCEHFQIDREKSHRALADATATYYLLERLWTMFKDISPNLFEPCLLQYKPKKQGPITRKQKNDLMKLINYHRIDLKQSIDHLTRNEASRLTNRILVQYGRVKTTI